MKVYSKHTGEEVEVYKIDTDSSGYPKFLIYKEGQWLWRSAKHFTPTKPVDNSDKLELIVDGFRKHLSDRLKETSSLQYAIADTPLCPNYMGLPEVDCDSHSCNECWKLALEKLDCK